MQQLESLHEISAQKDSSQNYCFLKGPRLHFRFSFISHLITLDSFRKQKFRGSAASVDSLGRTSSTCCLSSSRRVLSSAMLMDSFGDAVG